MRTAILLLLITTTASAKAPTLSTLQYGKLAGIVLGTFMDPDVRRCANGEGDLDYCRELALTVLRLQWEHYQMILGR